MYIICITPQVLPSQRQSKTATMYCVWVVIHIDNGWILTANCTCMAGLGSSCSHVAALLFKLEAAAHFKLNNEVACTSKLCAWKGTKKHVDPAPIKNINFKRSKKHALPASNKASTHAASSHFSVTDPYQGPSGISKEQFNDLKHRYSTAVVFTSICDAETSKDRSYDDDTDSDTENDENFLPEPIISLYDPTSSNLSCDELVSHSLQCYKEYESSYPQKAYDNLCTVTRTQSLSKIWMLHRAGRITASISHQVSRMNIEKPSKSLLSKVLQYEVKSSCSNKYTRYGRQHESDARELYTCIALKLHKDLSVVETGLHVTARMPFLGASPDGLVSCKCHPKRILEIKCPYKYQHGFRHWKEDRDFPITNELNMKRNHKYYFQMQLQMYMCDVQEGDFFMYTPANKEDYFLLNIRYDELFMRNLLINLKSKFENSFLPEIVSRRSEEVVSDRQLICKCRRPEFGQMIACENPNCEIG